MEWQNILRKAIEIGHRTGFITFDQLDELCKDKIDSEDIEALLGALSDEGIQVIEDE